MKAVHVIAFILLVIGGLNWGLVGIADYNVVDALLGEGSLLAKIVYILVGISAIVAAATHKRSCKECVPSMSSAGAM